MCYSGGKIMDIIIQDDEKEGILDIQRNAY